MIKNIIKYIDKIINPQKYYINNVTKNIKKLNVGDKIYVMFIPDIEKLTTYTSLSALECVELTTCIVDYICTEKIGTSKTTTLVGLRLIFDKYYNGILCGITYYTSRDDESGKKYITNITLNEKIISHNSFNTKNYLGYTIFTTNKKTIKTHLKLFADTIKYRITERILYNEQHQEQENIWSICKSNQNEYGNCHIIKYKKQYAKILQQLRLI